MDSVQSQQSTGINSGTDQYSSPSQQKKNNNKIYSIIAVILFILIIGELGYVYFYHNSSFKQLFSSSLPSIKQTQIQPSATSIPKVAPAKLVVVSTVGPADTACCKITVDNVILSPHVTGDPPNNGVQYLEIDLSVTNIGDTTGAIPGTFYYLNTAGKIFYAADVKGPGTYSNKNVTIPNKKSLFTVELTPQQTVKGVYLLYQIKPGDKGQLEWDAGNGKKTVYPLFQKK